MEAGRGGRRLTGVFRSKRDLSKIKNSASTEKRGKNKLLKFGKGVL